MISKPSPLFRVWDHIRERFWTTDITYKDFRRLPDYALTPQNIDHCTGIRDVNGNFIYEGDIVTAKLLTEEELKTYAKGCPNPRYYLCVYTQSSTVHGFTCRSFHEYPFHESLFLNGIGKRFPVRVVGNIRSHPEILNEHVTNPQLLDYLLKGRYDNA